MNKLTLLFGVLLCLVVVNARHLKDDNGEDFENEEETLRRSQHAGQSKHRRRRWQSGYGYDYPPPSFQYHERRDYDRTSQELQQIAKILDEISTYLRRPPPPPPPPQPIYIPYPMYIPQISGVSCNPQNATGTDGTLPAPKKRINIKEMDPNQNWGLVVSNENDYDDGSDGSRPISFDPIVPKQIMNRPTPKVEHGSVQGAASTAAPNFQSPPALGASSAPVPGMCNAAILSCCGISQDKVQQGQCFNNIGCSTSYANGEACSAQSIQKALDSFRVAYSPLA